MTEERMLVALALLQNFTAVYPEAGALVHAALVRYWRNIAEEFKGTPEEVEAVKTLFEVMIIYMDRVLVRIDQAESKQQAEEKKKQAEQN